MAVPTDVLNDDIRELKGDIRDIRGDLDVLKADVHRIDVSLAELRSDVRSAVSLGKWAATVVVATLLGGGVSAIWWAATINANVGNLEKRLDKLEASIARVIELVKPPAAK